MPRLPASAIAALAVLTVLGTGCARSLPQGQTPYAPTAEMVDVLAERRAMHPREPSQVSLQEARDVPSLVEAAQAIENVQGLPASTVTVSQFTQPIASGAAGPLRASLYRPGLAKDTPVILLFPGGTWATRRDVAADQVARELARRTGWVVVSLRPRLAPEVRFPAIHDDAFAAYQWARAEMRGWGADPTRVILAGEGPGANLALSTALLARDRQVPMPDGLLLITPWAGTATNTASMAENGGSQPLTRATVRWAQRQYAGDDLDNPRIDLAARSDLGGLPPTWMVLADIDPLRSGAEALAARMQQAGDRVDVRRYAGVTYDSFGLGQAVPRAAEAEQDVAEALKTHYDRPVARARARR